MPGSQRTLKPFMRLYRASMSCSVELRACPRCSAPVMFGGGMTIEKQGFFDERSGVAAFSSIQNFAHLSSTVAGSYVFSSVLSLISVFQTVFFGCKNNYPGL